MTCLSLWERWPSEARTERALSVTCGDSSPKGRAKELSGIRQKVTPERVQKKALRISIYP